MATTKTTLSNTAYTSLGTVPCTIQIENTNRPVSIVVANTLPANTAAGIVLNSLNGGILTLNYTTQNLYAKALKSDSTNVIVIR